MILPFALSVAMILAVPGPTNTLLTASAGTKGAGHAARLLAAEVCGYLVAITVLLTAGGWLVKANPIVGAALQACVSIYLLALAWRLWQSGTVVAAAESPVGARQVFLVTLTNPKALLFAYGIFPALPDAVTAAGHGLVFALTTMLVGSLWILFGAGLQQGLLSRGAAHLAPRIAAVAIAVFASGAAGSAIALL
jgi:threonine/homoserine/homoserine lactone efflux protein